MKIKSGFVLHTMGNENVVVAVEERTEEFRGMIRLNSTGAFLWRLMENECSEEYLSDALAKEYDITEKRAQDAVRAFIDTLIGANVIEL